VRADLPRGDGVVLLLHAAGGRGEARHGDGDRWMWRLARDGPSS
jgi:hypothetical protein